MTELETKDAIEILLREKKKAERNLEKAYDSYCLYPNEHDQKDWDDYSALDVALDMAIIALQNQCASDGDYIKKRDAVDIVARHSACYGDGEVSTDEGEVLLYDIMSEIMNYPSVEPKTGKWIPVTRIEEWSKEEGFAGFPPEVAEFPNCTIKYVDATEPDEVDAVKCSECGTVFDFTDARNWCSECGADMRGDSNDR